MGYGRRVLGLEIDMPSCSDYTLLMVRTQIQLTEEQLHKLRRAARGQGVGVAEISPLPVLTSPPWRVATTRAMGKLLGTSMSTLVVLENPVRLLVTVKETENLSEALNVC